MPSAATCTELWEGREDVIRGRRQITAQWLVAGAVDEDDAYLAMTEQIPATVNIAGVDLDLRNMTIRRKLRTWGKAEGESTVTVIDFTAEVTYDSGQAISSVSFDTGGGTQHITTSRGTLDAYGPKAVADPLGVIGWDGQTVAGCDILVPKMEWSETITIPFSSLTEEYVKTLRDLTGTTNDAAFRGFQPYEVLFLGAQGSSADNDYVDITFKFAAGKNNWDNTGDDPPGTDDRLTIGTIVHIEKTAWDYLWVQYDTKVDATAKVTYKEPVAVYIEDVYEFADFSALNLPASPFVVPPPPPAP
jgi:hypothetical protein